jgi:hypothetical protein
VDARDIETLRPLFETFRKLLGMLRTYRPEPYPGPITLFRAEQRAMPAPADLGWAYLAGGGLEIRQLPGDHAGVIRGAGAERLAEEFKGGGPLRPAPLGGPVFGTKAKQRPPGTAGVPPAHPPSNYKGRAFGPFILIAGETPALPGGRTPGTLSAQRSNQVGSLIIEVPNVSLS